MKIYVASSWRNEEAQQRVVKALRDEGHEVYDFRNPCPGDNGFSWKQIDPDREWLKDPVRFRAGLQHPVAQRGFKLDMDALYSCDACVLVLPCGRSAHLELGWAAGAGKRAIVLLDNPVSEPELMYLACTMICVSMDEVIEKLAEPLPSRLVLGDMNYIPERVGTVSLAGMYPPAVYFPLSVPEAPTAGWRIWWDEETKAVWAIGSNGTKTRLEQ